MPSSITHSISFTNKEVNQDFILFDKRDSRNICVLADGVGSYFASEKAAQLACTKMIKYCEKDIDRYNYPNVYRKIVTSLREELLPNYDEDTVRNKYGTTLISCIETMDRFIFSYVGNGAIMHFRGNSLLPKRSVTDSIPFTCLLNPHSKIEHGRNKLTRFLSPFSTRRQLTPSIVEIDKDVSGSGDIIILCTDGIYSKDEERTGTGKNGSLYAMYDEIVILLYDILSKFINSKSYNQETLESYLEQFKKLALERNLVHDDTTLAVIITDQVISFHENIDINE